MGLVEEVIIRVPLPPRFLSCFFVFSVGFFLFWAFGYIAQSGQRPPISWPMSEKILFWATVTEGSRRPTLS